MQRANILKQYVKEICRYPLLTAEEERELAIRVQNGDEKAKEKLITSNLRLVVKIAKEMNYGKFSVMDLIQSGNEGLMKSVERFDPERNIRFSSYAAYWIRQAIWRFLCENKQIEKISHRMQDKKRDIHRHIESFFLSMSRLPSALELAKMMDISLFEAAEELRAYYPQMSEGVTFDLDDIPDGEDLEEKVERECLSETLQEVIKDLDEHSRDLIKMRYGLEDGERCTLGDLARRFHMSVEGVRQKERRILSMLQDKYSFLRAYLA
ncbi:sigma-70 family RNA polymerase sigma factor [Thermospira aquatica]|uniref:Sigma-70 family RNA polymerase sigma factor n=1 Tax=Thermospira aquatica TaxID=2828656 RepID=A0AAX3BFX9_9SPIR|nr:sigma-70 family RNA polymerase sigma factor [Thermospira aquatica]URA11106.1 sigma-70 family RNA polymerase sigma factor [Thermospira aquatica]